MEPKSKAITLRPKLLTWFNSIPLSHNLPRTLSLALSPFWEDLDHKTLTIHVSVKKGGERDRSGCAGFLDGQKESSQWVILHKVSVHAPVTSVPSQSHTSSAVLRGVDPRALYPRPFSTFKAFFAHECRVQGDTVLTVVCPYRTLNDAVRLATMRWEHVDGGAQALNIVRMQSIQIGSIIVAEKCDEERQ